MRQYGWGWEESPAIVAGFRAYWGQPMQIKIRQPMTVDVTAAGDKTSFTIRFITKGEHEAAVIVPAEMLSDLTFKLQAIAGEPEPENSSEDDRRNLLLRALSGGVTRAA